jgi:pimeloyl-ACP methyl ester carboxylesterase
MPGKKHIIIYSHGFGVRKDDLGLLTDIAAALPGVESILFDYFAVNESEKTMLICPLSSQAEKLQQVINETRIANPEAIIDLICHSQGTVVAALAKPDGIRKAIMLSPVFDMSLERTLARYRLKPGADINLKGISKIPSSDGLVRIVPKEYWQERLAAKPLAEYNAFVKKTEIIAIKARQDELLPEVNLEGLDSKVKLISLDGNHSFDGSARKPLIAVIKDLLKYEKHFAQAV